MVTCNRCGVENPLGRVFCGGCGGKLDLSQMGRDTVAEKVKINWFLLHWRKFLVGIVVLLLALVALAFWPQTRPIIKKEVTVLGGQRVVGALRVLENLRPGRTLGRDFTEEDINGFFEFVKSKEMGAKSVSVVVGDGWFRVRVIRLLGSFKFGTFVVEPTVSYDLMCVPMGGIVRVTQLTMGHLTWLGPFRRTVLRRVHGMFAAAPEWAVLLNANDIQAEEGKIWLEVGKK
jgi:hypothetical protein